MTINWSLPSHLDELSQMLVLLSCLVIWMYHILKISSPAEWQNILKMMKEKSLQPRILYPARLSFRFDGEIKILPDKQKLREFSTTVLKRWDYLTTLPDSWEACMQLKKQQLESDVKQLTGSKLGKEYVNAICCHSAYLSYMQLASCKMPGWMKHIWNQYCWGNINNLRYAEYINKA